LALTIPDKPNSSKQKYITLSDKINNGKASKEKQ